MRLALGTIGAVSGRPTPAPVRRAVVWVVVLLTLLATAGPLAGTASAHATLVSSSPGNDEVVQQAPSEVRLTFDEGVSVAEDGIHVVDPDGNRVDDGAPDVSSGGTVLVERVDAGPEGTYTVSYRVLSDDGHVIEGSYVYHVGHRSGGAHVEDEGASAGVERVLGAVGRWFALTGALLVGGVLAMAVFVDRGTGDDGDRSWSGGLERSRRLLLPGAVAVLVGTALALLAAAAQLAGRTITGGVGRVPDFVTASWAGSVAGLRVLVALVLVVAIAGGPLLRRLPWLAAICILGTLALPSLGGHAWTASPAWLAVTSDVLHVLGAAAWVGGLAVLVLTWEGSRGRARSFSAVAVVAAPLVIATGLLNTWMQERSLGAVTDTAHGRLVLAKLAGALVMVAFGAVHRRRLADAARSVGSLLTSFRVEAVVGLGVVALTAVLVATPPGRESTGEPVHLVRQAGDTTIRMNVTPAESGPNDVHLYYLAKDGSLASIDAAQLEVSTSGIAPRRVELVPITASHAVATGVQLTPGTWRFALTVVTEGVPARTTFEVPIR